MQNIQLPATIPDAEWAKIVDVLNSAAPAEIKQDFLQRAFPVLYALTPAEVAARQQRFQMGRDLVPAEQPTPTDAEARQAWEASCDERVRSWPVPEIPKPEQFLRRKPPEWPPFEPGVGSYKAGEVAGFQRIVVQSPSANQPKVFYRDAEGKLWVFWPEILRMVGIAERSPEDMRFRVRVCHLRNKGTPLAVIGPVLRTAKLFNALQAAEAVRCLVNPAYQLEKPE